MARRLAFDASEKISLRTIAWVDAVVVKSKKSISALELEFQPPLPKGKAYRSRSYIWQKYKKGIVVPRSDIGLDGKDGLVQRVDKRYPGTAAVFNSPLWELCSQTPIEMSQVKAVYCSFPPALRKQFVGKADAKFWRKPCDPDELCESLLRERSLNGLVALVCLAREAEAIQSPSLYRASVNTIVEWLDQHGADCGVLNEAVCNALAKKFRAYALAI